MKLSPEDTAHIRREAANLLYERALLELGGNLDSLIRLPVPIACHLSGMSQKQLARKCQIIRDGHRDHYITLAEYKAKLLPEPAQEPQPRALRAV